MNRLAELLQELKNHVGETYNTLDKGSTGKNIRHDANALAKTLKSSFPMLEKDPQYVGAEDLINSGFGVMPLSTKLPETAFSKAHALAQKNAALPVEQGGLGLNIDNTAMERARALGFDVDNPVYHGTQKSFDKFNDGQVWLTNKQQVANQFATERSVWEGANVMPLLHRAEDSLMLNGDYRGIRDIEKDFLNTNKESIYDIAKKGNFDSVHIKNAIDDSPTFFNIAKPSDLTILPNNKKIRSRFAAFDPMQKNSANILASLLLGIGLTKEDK